jgi:hypothetical protein
MIDNAAAASVEERRVRVHRTNSFTTYMTREAMAKRVYRDASNPLYTK